MSNYEALSKRGRLLRENAFARVGAMAKRRIRSSKAVEQEIGNLIEAYYGPDCKEAKKIFTDAKRGYFWNGGEYVDNYFKYGFYRLKKRARKEYSVEMTTSLMYAWGYFNQNEFSRIFQDKYLFAKKFSNYMFRDFLLISDDSTLGDFSDFCSSRSSVFLKPRYALLGRGCFRLEPINENQVHAAWKKMRDYGEDYLVEETVQCDESIRQYHPSSVNTLRVITIRTSEDVEVLCAYQRFGNNGADQDHSNVGALQALVDIETGIVCTSAIDKRNRKFVKHPYSGKVIPGLQLKNWDELLQTVKEMALIVPEVRFIGWDMALDENERWVVIEGNDNAGFEAAQVLGGGLAGRIEEIIRNEQRAR